MASRSAVGRDRMTVQTKDSPPDRAAEYLRRIARLTGAKQTPEGYLLKSGNRDFLVDSKFVRVLSHRRKSTCFSVGKDSNTPSAEIVASALLQLKSNPNLFKKWRNQPGYLFKANGETFRSVRRCNWFEI